MHEIQPIAALLCLSAIQEEKTNNISLINVIEEVKFGLPKALEHSKEMVGIETFSFCAVSFWRLKNTGEQHFKLITEIIDPAGTVVKRNENEAPFPRDKKRLRILTNIQGISLTKAGEYQIKTTLQSTTDPTKIYSASSPLDVSIDYTN